MRRGKGRDIKQKKNHKQRDINLEACAGVLHIAKSVLNARGKSMIIWLESEIQSDNLSQHFAY